jgi:outer membrane protein TolC
VLNERRIESANLNLQAGRASTRDILEAQQALVDARNSLTSARVDYYLSQLALWRDMELLRVEDQGLRFAREGLDPTATDDVGSATEEQGEAAAPQETR